MIHIKGVVLPSFVSVTTTMRAIRWEVPEIAPGRFANFTVGIDNSNVDVAVDVDGFSPEHLMPLYKRALDLTRVVVDLYSFCTGMGLNVMLNSYVDQNGKLIILRFNDPTLGAHCTAFRVNSTNADDISTFHKIYESIVVEPDAFMALRDLVTVLTIPHHSALNAARVIEGLRTAVTPGIPREMGWVIFRENLNLSEGYLKFITDHSKGPRHGDRVAIPGSITVEIDKRAWIIMNRFLEFRKRGNHPLPIDEFPLLSS